MLLELLLLAADVPEAGNDLQLHTMLRFLRLRAIPHSQRRLQRRHILRSEKTVEDVCDLRNVRCVDGVVQSIIWKSPAKGMLTRLAVDMEWVPPTVQAIHLQDCATLKAYSLDKYPRNLEYLLLERCTRIHSAFNRESFHRLPARMEELHFVDCFVRGIVDLTTLPRSMRVITLYKLHITRVVVYNDLLPFRLQTVRIASVYKRMVVDKPKKVKVDDRVYIGQDDRASHQTDRYAACAAYIEELKAEIDADVEVRTDARPGRRAHPKRIHANRM